MMERYFQDNRTYAAKGAFTPPCQTGDDASRTVGKFVISCTGALTAEVYTLQAKGTGSVVDFTMTVNQKDEKATTAAPGDWGQCTKHWTLKRGQTC
jgi:type IV pilus assembly protein PilE